MSNAVLGHGPPRTAPERHAIPPVPSVPRRSRVEAGVLSLVLAAILVFTAGFATLFPESARSPVTWSSYADPAGTFELRYPARWIAQESPRGVVLQEPGDAMVVGVTRIVAEGATVEQLARERIQEVADLGAAEVSPRTWPRVDGRPTLAIRELTWGDGRVTTRLYVQVDDRTFLSIAAWGPAGTFDASTFSSLLGSMRLTGRT